MRLKQLLFTAALLSFSAQTLAKTSDYAPYVIKKGDNTSQILADNSLFPLYGKSQWVEKVLKLNRMNQETAKKLEPGDVIIIPIATNYFSESEYNDSISTMKSSWTREYIATTLAPKQDNLTLSTSYFNKTHQFTSEDVSVQQNFMATVQYKKRKVENNGDYSINPIITASVYTQSNADFDSNSTLVAEFTPSTILSAGAEIEKRDINTSLIFEAQYESFSTLDQTANSFDVTRENLVWLGMGLGKTLNISTYEVFGNISYFRGNQFDAQKAVARLGTYIKRNYMFDVFASSTSFNISSDVQIISSGVSLGYRF